MGMETDHAELQIYVFFIWRTKKRCSHQKPLWNNIPATTVRHLSGKIPTWWVDESHCSMRCTPGAFVLHILKLFVNYFLHDRDSAGKMLGVVSCLSPAHTGSLGISAASKGLEITVALHQSPELIWSCVWDWIKHSREPAPSCNGHT